MIISSMRIAAKLLFHGALAVVNRRSYRFPLAIYVYLSFRCNLNCEYCDSGDGRSFPTRPYDELTVEQWRKLLPLLRRWSDVLLISGGEPLVHADPLGFLRVARESGFAFISLNTNGILLTPELVDAADAIIVSLDSLDREASDRLWNRTGATETVLSRLEELRHRDHPTVMVNCVVLPGRVAEAEAVLDYCLARGLTFSLAPGVRNRRPMPGLADDPAYHKLLDRLILEKRCGRRIAGTVAFLRGIKTFRRYQCHPQLVWRIRPNGDLVYPCSRCDSVIGNLLSVPEPIRLLHAAAGGEFYDPGCGEACPLSCYMDTSLVVTRPMELVREGFYRLRSFPAGHRVMF
ncbi:MAG: radical SAM protein [Candidatus Riflebacteria bacterium]|nr:radical SAM protein [Candidatus Riflebacteria bacterium]